MTLDAARGLLACPHCEAPLAGAGPYWHCPAGHTFDVARQGYLNLSTAAEPANADTAQMLAARDRIHAAGVFDALTWALGELIPASLRATPQAHPDRATPPPIDPSAPSDPQPTPARTAQLASLSATFCEVGAGNAHYLAELVSARQSSAGLAVDVSRAAARRAARAHPRVASVVADAWRRLPVRSGVADVVLSVFAPRNPTEFARVLAPAGRLVVATPSADHLARLRARYGLLGIEPQKRTRLLASLADDFTLDRTVLVRDRVDLAPELVNDLIGMGPNAHHHPPRADRGEQVEIAVEVQLFHRT